MFMLQEIEIDKIEIGAQVAAVAAAIVYDAFTWRKAPNEMHANKHTIAVDVQRTTINDGNYV